MPHEVELAIEISAPAADRQELEELTDGLAAELRERETESVRRRPSDEVAKGSKVADPFTLGALVLVAVPVALPKILEFLQNWASRRDGQAVRIKSGDIEIEFTPSKRMSGEEMLRIAEQMSSL